MSKGLPLIVQSIVYRKNDQNFEVLLLKRNEERGGFWNVVNGTLEINESILECRKRELFEEAGIKEVLSWSDEINRFSFKYNNYNIVVLAYAAMVEIDQIVIINEEHTEYKWVNYKEAKEILSFVEVKETLDQVFEYLKIK